MVTLIFAVVCCGLYPLVVFGVAQVFFRDQANGSLIVDANGTVHGSKLLGQQFTADKYFQSRPSAAGNGYDATSSGGSNLGPTSSNLVDHHHTAHFRLPHAKQSRHQRPRSRRRRHRVRQRPRPAHQPAQRRTPGAPRRQSPQPQRGKSSGAGPRKHRPRQPWLSRRTGRECPELKSGIGFI